MGAFLITVGVGLSVLLVLYAIGSALSEPRATEDADSDYEALPLVEVDPDDEDDEDGDEFTPLVDTDLYVPTAADFSPRPLGTGTDTGKWLRAEGRKFGGK